MATVVLGNTPTNIEDCEAITGWTFLSIATDGDNYKEGSNSILGILRNDQSTAIYDITTDGGAAIDLTGEHIRAWINFIATPYLDIEANGGMELILGDVSNLAYWTVFGSDTYGGGWKNIVLDCDSSPHSGSFNKAAVTRFGFRFNRTAAPANKDNTYIDYLHYGAGYYATGGTSGDEIDLALMLAEDVANGDGILDSLEGVYFGYGELQIGNGATTTWFKMSGDVLVFTDSPVGTGLYALRGEGSGCRVVIENSVIQAAGSTDATRFILDMDDVDIVSCSITGSFFARGGECRFKSGQTITGNTFIDCGQILPDGADLSTSIVSGFEGTVDTAALVWDNSGDPDGELDNMVFVKGSAATHAIEFGTSAPSSITLRGMDFSGYNASDTENDSTFLVSATGGTVTINVVGCSGNFTYKSAGATVVIVPDPVTVKVTAKTATGTEIQDARVLVKAANGTGPFPFEEVVTSITNSGTTATVAHTGHGMASNDKVVISGASLQPNNGVFQIARNDDNEYEYTMSSAPGSSPTGTIIATFAALSGLTDVNGEISTSRVYSADQPVVGWARKSSTTPLYKSGPIAETVDSADGMNTTAVLILDE